MITIPREPLRTILAKVRHAMSWDETRPQLSHAWVGTVNGKLVARATDGHRLHQATAEFDGEVLPIMFSHAAVGMICARGDTCVVRTEVVTACGEGVRVTKVGSDLVGGAWSDPDLHPRYDYVIPASVGGTVCTLERADWLKMVSGERLDVEGVRLNAKYWTDAIKACGKQATVRTWDKDAPALITSPDVTCVVMPVRQ